MNEVEIICPNCKNQIQITAIEIVALQLDPTIAIYFWCPTCNHQARKFYGAGIRSRG
jgi:hypothetical protein